MANGDERIFPKPVEFKTMCGRNGYSNPECPSPADGGGQKSAYESSVFDDNSHSLVRVLSIFEKCKIQIVFYILDFTYCQYDIGLNFAGTLTFYNWFIH